jgi:hypothetical protein
MSLKSLSAVPLLAALILASRHDTSSAAMPNCPAPRVPPACPKDEVPEPPPPEGDPPLTHTMTIYNGDHVTRRTFIYFNGAWRACEDFKRCDVLVRDCPSSPWRCYRSGCSPCQAEEAACSLKARGKHASIRPCGP